MIGEAIKGYKDGALVSLLEFELGKRYDEAILALKTGIFVGRGTSPHTFRIMVLFVGIRVWMTKILSVHMP